MGVDLVAPSSGDRQRVYDWMTTPGIVERMMGPPTFPEKEVPDFQEFVEDWLPYYWTHASPAKGRLFLVAVDSEPVGMVAHNDVVTTSTGVRASELDTWLRGPEYTGRGYGPAAIERLVTRLVSELAVEQAFLQPSARNPAAIRAYETAGFARVSMEPVDAARHFRTEPDYADAVFLARDLS